MARTRSQTRAQSQKRSKSTRRSRAESTSESSSAMSSSRSRSRSATRGRPATKKTLHGRVARGKHYAQPTASSRSRSRPVKEKKETRKSNSKKLPSATRRTKSVDTGNMDYDENGNSRNHPFLQELPFSPIEVPRSIDSSSEYVMDDSTFVLHTSIQSPSKANRLRRATSTPKLLSEHMKKPATLLREVLLKGVNKSKSQYDADVYSLESESETEADVEMMKVKTEKSSVARELFPQSKAAEAFEVPCILSAPLQVRTGQVVCVDPVSKKIFLQTIITIVSSNLKPNEIEDELCFAKEVRPEMTVGSTCLENGATASTTVQRVFVGRRVIVIEKNTMFSQKNIPDPITTEQSRLYPKVAPGIINEKAHQRPTDEFLSIQSTDESTLDKDIFRKREFITLNFSSLVPTEICLERKKSIPMVLKSEDKKAEMSQFHEHIFTEGDKIIIDREVLIDTRATTAGHIWDASIITRKEERREYSYMIKEKNGSLAYISELISNEANVWEYSYFKNSNKTKTAQKSLTRLIQSDLDRSRVIQESPSFPKVKEEEPTEATLLIENFTDTTSKFDYSSTDESNKSKSKSIIHHSTTDENTEHRDEIVTKLQEIGRKNKERLSATMPVSKNSAPKSFGSSKSFGEAPKVMEHFLEQCLDDSHSETMRVHEKVLHLQALINNKPYSLISKYRFSTNAENVHVEPLKLVVDGQSLFDVKDKHGSTESVEKSTNSSKKPSH
ncbi:unnamed protein product [Auanema sp. JU1783]|nr:unnamed protein product [Auanema sp. JU1783]